MVKKFIIVCICLVTIVTVLGVNDRLNYDGLDRASRMVTGGIDFVKDDVAFLEVFAHIAESYPLSDDGTFYVEYHADTDMLVVSYPTAAGGGSVASFTMPSDDIGAKLESLLKPLDFGIPNPGGFFDEVIDGVNYIIHILVLAFIALQFLLIIIFDSFGVVLSALRAAFYLLGF